MKLSDLVDFRCMENVAKEASDLGYDHTGDFHEGSFDQFRSYILAADLVKPYVAPGTPIARGEESMVVLVDGRARLPCALYMLRYMTPNSVLFLHDFWYRPYYMPILKYFDVIASSHTMLALHPKPEFVGESVDVKGIADHTFAQYHEDRRSKGYNCTAIFGHCEYIKNNAKL